MCYLDYTYLWIIWWIVNIITFPHRYYYVAILSVFLCAFFYFGKIPNDARLKICFFTYGILVLVNIYYRRHYFLFACLLITYSCMLIIRFIWMANFNPSFKKKLVFEKLNQIQTVYDMSIYLAFNYEHINTYIPMYWREKHISISQDYNILIHLIDSGYELKYPQDKHLFNIILFNGLPSDVRKIIKWYKSMEMDDFVAISIILKNNNLQCLEVLCQHVNFNVYNREGNSVLIEAVKMDSPNEIISYLAARTISVNYRNFMGDSAIFFCRSLRMVNHLLLLGANINLSNDFKETCFIDLCQHIDSPQLIDLFIEHKFDIKKQSSKGYFTPYKSVCLKLLQEGLPITQFMEYSTNNESLFMYVCRQGWIDCIQWMITSDKVDYDYKDKVGKDYKDVMDDKIKYVMLPLIRNKINN